MTKVAFFDTKEYDVPEFERYGKENDIAFKFFETNEKRKNIINY